MRKWSKPTQQDWLAEAIKRDTDDCILWPYGVNRRTGYGSVCVDGKMMGAHRYSCTLAHGHPPSPKHNAAHDNNGKPCASRTCINPKHLRWVTHKENSADMLLHGTRQRGSEIGISRLTEDQVKQIMAMSGTKPQREIAEMFGVTQKVVSGIHRRTIWNWVEPESPIRRFLGPRVTDIKAYKAAKAREYRARDRALKASKSNPNTPERNDE